MAVDAQHIKLFTEVTGDYTLNPDTKHWSVVIKDSDIDELLYHFKENPGTFIQKPEATPWSLGYDINEEVQSFYLLLDLLMTIPNTQKTKTEFEALMKVHHSKIESHVGLTTYCVFLAICKNVIISTEKQKHDKNLLQIQTKGKQIVMEKELPGVITVYISEGLIDHSTSDYSAVRMAKKLCIQFADKALLSRICARTSNLNESDVKEKGYANLLTENWKTVAEAQKFDCVKLNFIGLQLLCKRFFCKN